MGYNLRDSLTILGVILVVAFLIAVLTIVTRRRKHRHRPQLSRSVWPARASKSQTPPGGPSASRDGHRRRHRHRRRRQHRPRNPTLADTGGLPPPRAGETPPPAL